MINAGEGRVALEAPQNIGEIRNHFKSNWTERTRIKSNWTKRTTTTSDYMTMIKT